MANERMRLRRNATAWIYCFGACAVGGWFAAHEYPIIPVLGCIAIGGAVMMRLGWLMHED
jgi:hypothetical protein